jgi:hypothetical protein
MRAGRGIEFMRSAKLRVMLLHRFVMRRLRIEVCQNKRGF